MYIIKYWNGSKFVTASGERFWEARTFNTKAEAQSVIDSANLPSWMYAKVVEKAAS